MTRQRGSERSRAQKGAEGMGTGVELDELAEERMFGETILDTLKAHSRRLLTRTYCETLYSLLKERDPAPAYAKLAIDIGTNHCFGKPENGLVPLMAYGAEGLSLTEIAESELQGMRWDENCRAIFRT